MKCRSISTRLEFVEGHDHDRKCGYERLRFAGDRCAANCERSAIDADRSALRKKRGDFFGSWLHHASAYRFANSVSLSLVIMPVRFGLTSHFRSSAPVDCKLRKPWACCLLR